MRKKARYAALYFRRQTSRPQAVDAKAKISHEFRLKSLDIGTSGGIIAGSLDLAGPGVGQIQTWRQRA